jgi:hypothetical protein
MEAAEELEYLEQQEYNKKTSNFASLMGDNLDKNLFKTNKDRIRDSCRNTQRAKSAK